MAVLERAIGQPEVIEHMLQRHACDRGIEIAHMGKVRRAKSARLMQLSEDDLALGPMQGTPAPDPPLQLRARIRQIAVPTALLLKDRNRTQPGRRFKQRRIASLRDNCDPKSNSMNLCRVRSILHRDNLMDDPSCFELSNGLSRLSWRSVQACWKRHLTK